jgi:hypothetical protein
MKVIMKPCLLIIFLSLSLSIYAQNPQKIYEFDHGKYRILDFPVNIRSQPGLTGSVIGKLELDSEIEIVENTKIKQTIENKTHYWYKINYGNIIGYIWGGLIAVEAYAFNINGNKILAYYRYSYTENRIIKINGSDTFFSYDMILPDDIFFYINQKPININDVIKKVYLEEYIQFPNSERYYFKNDWHYCNFYEKNGNIDLIIWDRGPTQSYFVIDKYGKIIHKESTMDGL